MAAHSSFEQRGEVRERVGYQDNLAQAEEGGLDNKYDESNLCT